MKKISIFFLLIHLASCSTVTKTNISKDTHEPSEEELSKIENSDFSQGKRVRFNREIDKFDAISTMESGTDSLMYESIARSPEFDLKSISETQEPISKIISLCYLKEFDDAEMIMDEVYKQYKKHPGYWNQIGTCYFLKGDLRKAMLYYNKSRSLSKDYAPPINNLGVIYQQRGFDQKALLAFQKASDLSSFSLTPIFNLAQIYLRYGFSKRARNLFKTLLKRGSRDVDALAGLATSYLMENQIKEAVDTFSQIPDGSRRKVNVGINYALALKKNGNSDEALNIIENIDQKNLGKHSSYFKSVEKFVRGK